MLCATSLGLVVPVLKDSGQIGEPTGQLVVVSASIADFGAVILLSLFFGGDMSSGGHEYVPFAGQSAGLVDDIRPAGEIVHDTVVDAEQILTTLAKQTLVSR